LSAKQQNIQQQFTTNYFICVYDLKTIQTIRRSGLYGVW